MLKFDQKEFARQTKGLPARVIAAIAVRSAMRVLPTLATRTTKEKRGFSYWRENQRTSHTLAIFRAYQNAVTASASAVLAAADSAANASNNAYTALAARPDAGTTDVFYAYAASVYAAYAASAADSAADSAANAYTAVHAACDAYNADSASAALKSDLTTAKSLSTGNHDVDGLIYALLGQPLWPNGAPKKITALWQLFQADAEDLQCGFEVWLDWYRDRLDGKPLDLEMELAWATLSKERLAQTPTEINAHLKALREGAAKKQFQRVRAIFIGHGGVGKSSIIAALHGDDVIEGKGTMTKGVAIQSSSSPVQRSSNGPGTNIDEGAGVFTRVTKIKERDLVVHFWDFGGQVMAHATHQFFLRARCLYVVVLDARVVNNANEDAEYWLEHVRAFGDRAPVMLVGNKIDQLPVNVDLRSLRDKHPNVIDFYPLSCTEAKGMRQAEFERFSRDFNHALLDLGKEGERFTAQQFEVLKAIEAEAAKSDFLPQARFREMCISGGIANDGSQATLLDLFDKLGIVIHFAKLPFLNDYVLNPRWLTYGVYTVMYSERAIAAKGRITDADIVAILADEAVETVEQRRVRYPLDRCHLIVQAMVAFGIAYRLPHDMQALVIPALLDPQQPEHDFKIDGSLAFQFDFKGFLPRHVLPTLIVDHHRDIARIGGIEIVWQSGVLLRPSRGIDADALIKADYHERKIDVLVNGSDAVTYFGMIRDTVLKTLQTMPELRYEEKVQLRPDMRLDQGEAARFGDPFVWMPYNIIRTVQKKKGQWLPGPDGCMYDIDKVLAVMPISPDLRQTDVFVSYAHDDRVVVEELTADIEHAGHTVWFDRNLVGGQQFRDVIDQRIDGAKAVIVLWTENSVGSKYVRYEADRASNSNKLVCLHDPNLDVKRIPGPFFANDHLLKIGDRAGLMAALARLGVR
jgi:hypothetical protein